MSEDRGQHYDPRIQDDVLNTDVQLVNSSATDVCFPADIVAYDPPKSRGGIGGWDSASLAGGCGGSSDADAQVFQGSLSVHTVGSFSNPHPNPCAGQSSRSPRAFGLGITGVLSEATEASRAVTMAAGRCVSFVGESCHDGQAQDGCVYKRLLLQAARAFRSRQCKADTPIRSEQERSCTPKPDESFPAGHVVGPRLCESRSAAHATLPVIGPGCRCTFLAGVPRPDESCPVRISTQLIASQVSWPFRASHASPPDVSYPAGAFLPYIDGPFHVCPGRSAGFVQPSDGLFIALTLPLSPQIRFAALSFQPGRHLALGRYHNRMRHTRSLFSPLFLQA